MFTPAAGDPGKDTENQVGNHYQGNQNDTYEQARCEAGYDHGNKNRDLKVQSFKCLLPGVGILIIIFNQEDHQGHNEAGKNGQQMSKNSEVLFIIINCL